MVSGQYINQTGIEQCYGQMYVAAWGSFTQGATTADPNRLTVAIQNAETFWDNGLTDTMYVVPLSAPGGGALADQEVLTAMCEYAGWWLWFTRGLNQTKDFRTYMKERHDEAVRLLQAVKLGRKKITAAMNNASQNANIPVMGNW